MSRLTSMEAYEKRNAAAHEAGHFLFSMICYFQLRASIWPSNTDDPLKMKTWIGTNESASFPHKSPLVSVAGVIGEYFFDNPDCDVEECLDALDDPSELSETDAAGMPSDDQLFAVVESVLGHLKRYRPVFERLVCQLFEQESVSLMDFVSGKLGQEQAA